MVFCRERLTVCISQFHRRSSKSPLPDGSTCNDISVEPGSAPPRQSGLVLKDWFKRGPLKISPETSTQNEWFEGRHNNIDMLLRHQKSSKRDS